MANGQWRLSTRGTNPETVLSTGLNSLASGSGAVSGTFDNNDATNGRDQYFAAELLVTFGTAPAANSIVELYCLPAVDGTNFPDGSSSIFPPNHLVGVFLVRAVTTAQRIYMPPRIIPALDHQWLLRNQAGQAFAASGNTLKIFYGGF